MGPLAESFLAKGSFGCNLEEASDSVQNRVDLELQSDSEDCSVEFQFNLTSATKF